MRDILKELFINETFEIEDNFIFASSLSDNKNQELTNDAFSTKWTDASKKDVMEKTLQFQKNWFLTLYGFESEEDLANYLSEQPVILDAGCGLGYKSLWFAELAPDSTVIGMDYSEASKIAAKTHEHTNNLYFIQGDIANTGFKPESLDFIVCDQVIHHTSDPPKTFSHLAGRLKKGGEFNCYVYAKKALPRELLDEYFREHISEYKEEEIWKLSEQLTELGKTLRELNTKIEVPDIPAFNIEGGEYDLQRFIYYNFFKCFWNKEQGYNASVSTNFDWYAPKNAFRYSLDEFKEMVYENDLEITHLHTEQACHSGRFKK